MPQLMQEEIVKLQPRGILTIPKKIRQSIGLEENTFVKIIKKNKCQLIIQPVRILPYPARSYTEKELNDFFKLDDKESKKLKKKGLL